MIIIPKSIRIDYEPTDKQLDAHTALERFILYGGAKGGGKTVWLVNEAITNSLRYPGNRGGLYRRVLKDLEDTTLITLQKYLPPEAIRNHNKGDRLYELINGSIIYYDGLGDYEDTKRKTGGKEFGWWGLDEAQEATEGQFLLLDGTLRHKIVGQALRYHGFLTANPEPGWLRDRFIDNRRDDHIFVPSLPRDNPHLPPDYEENLRKNWPEALVRRLMDGMWDVDMAGNYLIPYSQIRDAINRNIEPKGDKIAGVDVARMGGDETVCVLRQGDKVLHIESWAKEYTDQSAGRVARFIREHKPIITYIDHVGVGAGVFDPLFNEGFMVKGVDSSAQALDKEVYVNKRAEYFDLLAKKFQKGEIDIPEHPQLTSQLASLKFHFRGTRLLMESKEVMKKQGLKSPDYADALMYAFIDSANPTGTVIPVTHFG